jgi:hypothetical protein
MATIDSSKNGSNEHKMSDNDDDNDKEMSSPTNRHRTKRIEPLAIEEIIAKKKAQAEADAKVDAAWWWYWLLLSPSL